MPKIKVSVLTPIYNHDVKYVRECLESLHAQTLPEIELILIDNGANQESKALIEEFAQKDSRFKVLHIKKNEGYGKAMNLGLDNAQGEYIGIVESDDWVEPNMFETLYNIAKENNVSLVKSLYYECYEKNKKLINIFNVTELNKILKPTDIKNFLLTHASPWSILYKKELLNNFKIRISANKGNVAKDLGLVIKSFLSAENLYITEQAFYHYNLYNPNASMKTKNLDNILKMLMLEYKELYKWFNNKTQENKLNSKLKAFIDQRFIFNIQCHQNNYEFSTTQKNKISKFIKKHINNTTLFTPKQQLIFNNFNDFIKIKNNKKLNIKNIFSVKNDKNKKHKIITLLGIKIKFKNSKNKYDMLREEISSLKELIYQCNYLPQKVASLHQQVFPQFHNCHNNDNVIIVGCGPTLKHYNPIKSAYHISLNRAIRNTHIKFDYAFIWDLPGTINEEPEFIQEFLNYDCIKFVGQFLHDKFNTPLDINLPYKNKLYRCFSASRSGFGIPRCDTVIHQDISIFPLADFMSIAFGALNFAAYTHPKKIYLVGLDTKQTACFDGREHTYFMNEIMLGYKLFKTFLTRYYPDVEVISVNPVGLKGMFKDVYTQSYVDEHPELLKENIEILDTEKMEVEV